MTSMLFLRGCTVYPGWHPSIGPSAEPEDFAGPNGCFLVAYAESKPVGCGGIKRLDDKTGEVKRLYVVPEARGRGVARELMAALEETARHLRWTRIRLDTGNRQPDALALFRRAGYREIADYNANPYASDWFEKCVAKPTDERERQQQGLTGFRGTCRTQVLGAGCWRVRTASDPLARVVEWSRAATTSFRH